jgi:hypothetical protein
MSGRKSSKRIESAIADFQETLASFCETVLSSGSRNGNEWQVPDLENSECFHLFSQRRPVNLPGNGSEARGQERHDRALTKLAADRT